MYFDLLWEGVKNTNKGRRVSPRGNYKMADQQNGSRHKGSKQKGSTQYEPII